MKHYDNNNYQNEGLCIKHFIAQLEKGTRI